MKMTKTNAGYTMIELLVAMMLSGIALSVVATDFSHTVHQRFDMEQVAETQQAVSAALTFVSQELRQAGACLPQLGDFTALGGVDSGNRDSITLRIGKTDPGSLVCIRTVSTAPSLAGSSSLTVLNSSGFEVGQYVYLTRIAGQGSTFIVAAVGVESITVEGALDADYLTGSGVYAIEERTYSIDDSGPSPILTVAVDDGDPEPLAKGIEVFNVRYRLDPCEPCVTVDLPADNAEWRIVREVELTVAAQTDRPMQGGSVHVVEERTTIKPRNLI